LDDVRTRNEIVKTLIESFQKDLRAGHGARRIAERVADEFVKLDNDYQLAVMKLKAEFDAKLAALERELASTSQDFEDLMRTRPNNVVQLPPRPR
jgi:hypothetical protein